MRTLAVYPVVFAAIAVASGLLAFGDGGMLPAPAAHALFLLSVAALLVASLRAILQLVEAHFASLDDPGELVRADRDNPPRAARRPLETRESGAMGVGRGFTSAPRDRE